MSDQPASRAMRRNRLAGITVPTASESGSTLPCGRHHSTFETAPDRGLALAGVPPQT
jgi:hypothetical protein